MRVSILAPGTSPKVGEKTELGRERAFTFIIDESGDIVVRIYNVNGEVVREIRYYNMKAGKHTIFWDGRNDLGEKVATGLYFAAINDYITKVPHGVEAFTALHDLIRGGMSLETALKEFGNTELWNQVKNDPQLVDCIEKQLQGFASWDDALSYCKRKREIEEQIELLTQAGAGQDVQMSMLSGTNLVIFGALGLIVYYLFKDKF